MWHLSILVYYVCTVSVAGGVVLKYTVPCPLPRYPAWFVPVTMTGVTNIGCGHCDLIVIYHCATVMDIWEDSGIHGGDHQLGEVIYGGDHLGEV